MATLMLEAPTLVLGPNDHPLVLEGENAVDEELILDLGELRVALDTDDAMRFVEEIEEAVRAALAARGHLAA